MKNDSTFKNIWDIKQTFIYNIDWLLLIVLFLFVYQPPLFSFNIVYLLIIFLNITNFIEYGNGYIKITINLLKNRILFCMFGCSLMLVLYLVLKGLFSTIHLKQIYSISLTLLVELYCGFLIAQKFIMKKVSLNRFLEYFVLIGIIQALISIIAYIFPEIRNNIVNFYIFRGYPKEVYLYMTWRLYGFSSTLTYAMPIIQSFIACIAIDLGFNKRPLYFFTLPLLLFSSMINSRFGFLIFFPIAIIQIYLMNKNDHRISKKNIITLVLITIICTSVLFFLVYLTIPMTWIWILSSFRDILNLFNGSLTGFFAEIFGAGSSQLQIPSGLLFLFGSGSNIMGGLSGNASDIGFINDMWIGGIFYFITLWGMFLVVFSYIFNRSFLNHKYLLITLLCFMLISNIKGMVITPNELMSCVYVILTFYIMKLRKIEYNEMA